MAFAEVGLYWDFENVGLGAGFSMADLAALLTRVRGYGRLHESRLYYDSCKASSEGFLSKHRELVERLGVTLVDCPTSDKKEAIDKKIIVDCLVWALGRSSRLQSACVVLMSSDGDFAHMLSRLEQHGVRTIVIGRSAVLRTVCHTALTLREACSGADAKGGGKEGGGTEGGVAGDASGSGDDATAAVPAASRTSRARLQNEQRREQSRDHAQPQAQAHEKASAQARARPQQQVQGQQTQQKLRHSDGGAAGESDDEDSGSDESDGGRVGSGDASNGGAGGSADIVDTDNKKRKTRRGPGAKAKRRVRRAAEQAERAAQDTAAHQSEPTRQAEEAREEQAGHAGGTSPQSQLRATAAMTAAMPGEQPASLTSDGDDAFARGSSSAPGKPPALPPTSTDTSA